MWEVSIKINGKKIQNFKIIQVGYKHVFLKPANGEKCPQPNDNANWMCSGFCPLGLTKQGTRGIEWSGRNSEKKYTQQQLCCMGPLMYYVTKVHRMTWIRWASYLYLSVGALLRAQRAQSSGLSSGPWIFLPLPPHSVYLPTYLCQRHPHQW